MYLSSIRITVAAGTTEAFRLVKELLASSLFEFVAIELLRSNVDMANVKRICVELSSFMM